MRLNECRELPRRAGPGAIRQWLLAELTETYSYPTRWLKQRLRLIDGDAANVFGFALLTAKGDPFLFASIDPGSAALAESRLRQVLCAAPFARLGLSSDGTVRGTRVLRRRGNSAECDVIPDLEQFSHPEGQTPTSHNPEPIAASVEDVFFQAHSHIRDIDGLHADEALDELCKVIFAKLFDEQTAAPALRRGPCGTVEECAVTVRRVYHDANEHDARAFNAPIRLSSPALVKVVQTLEPYSLGRSNTDVKGRAFQRVLGPAVRSGMGQYFTPLEVIRFVVDVIEPTAADFVLDPFAGSGHFLTRSLDATGTSSDKLHGIEKSDRMVRVAMTDMRLHGDGAGNIRRTDALLDFANYPDLRPESFDVVMTNPPFGCLLGPEAVGRLGAFALAAARKSVPLEILGLERCVQFLRPGGRLGIVLPDGLLANRNADHVRRWLADHVKVRAVVSLPVETFAPFGANVKTSVLVARKWKRDEPRGDYNVHLARVDHVGYDAGGRPQDGSELPAVADAVRAFIRREGW
jgi:type I restriction enzyme M protein